MTTTAATTPYTDYESADRPPNGFVTSVIGRREAMEDVEVYAKWRRNGEWFELMLVCDGHGGKTAAEFVRRHMPRAIARYLTPENALDKRREAAAATEIATAFVNVQQAMERSKNRLDYEKTGTTAVVSIRIRNKLIVANCGDSRAVLIRSGHSYAITRDHRPSDANERRRIESLGAHVSKRDGDVPRIRELGLSVSRGLGDLESRVHGRPGVYVVSPLPDVFAVDLVRGVDTQLMLCCDGIFETLHNTDLAKMATTTIAPTDPKSLSERIVRSAYNRGSGDNLTACIINLF